MKPIQDVVPPKKKHLKNFQTETLIEELWDRGVDIQRIFGQFYALEEMANHRSDLVFGNDEDGQHGIPPLTVGDVELAGLTSLPNQPIPRQPF